jgi:hypothetical protein
MRVKLPRPEEQFPDPKDRPSPQDRLELEQNPAFLLMLARLQRLAVVGRRRSDKSKEDDEWIKEARIAQGVERALEEIDAVLRSGTVAEED